MSYEAAVPAEPAVIEAVRHHLEVIADSDADELTVRRELEEINFAIIRPVVAEAIELGKELKDLEPQLTAFGGGRMACLRKAAEGPAGRPPSRGPDRLRRERRSGNRPGERCG